MEKTSILGQGDLIALTMPGTSCGGKEVVRHLGRGRKLAVTIAQNFDTTWKRSTQSKASIQ